MKTYRLQKRLAAKILNVGIKRVWFDPDKMSEIAEAITAEDIKELIKNKAIKRKPKISKKSKSIRYKLKNRKKRRRGEGKIKKRVRHRKRKYVNNIRKLRKFITFLKKQGKINSKQARAIRKRVKSGDLKNTRMIEEYLGRLK